MSGKMVDAEILMELAWENPLLTEPDCAFLFRLIEEAQAEEKRRKSS